MIASWLSIAALLLAVAGCAYLLAAVILVGRFGRRDTPMRAGAPAITLLKPLHGSEPGLLENLISFCAQDYAGRVQIVFGVQDAGDGALAAVERLRSLQPLRDIDLVVDAQMHGLNPKVSNLINMEQRIRHDVVVLADSDMRVDKDYLSRTVAALEGPGVGAVTWLYYGMPQTGIWAQLSALSINSHFLPSVLVGLASSLARPCFGSTIALKRETLAGIGGFRALADQIADDYAIGNAVRAQGGTIAIPPFAIAHVCTETSAAELWLHDLRWARTIRSIDPIGYAGSIIAHPFPWALTAALGGAGAGVVTAALGAAGLALALRMALLRQVSRTFGLSPRPYWLVPARELWSFAVLVTSFLGRRVSWKHRRYRI